MPQYAICKLENQESSGIIQSEFKGLGTTGADGVTLSPRLKMDVSDQGERLTLPLPFCSIWALSGLDDECPHW